MTSKPTKLIGVSSAIFCSKLSEGPELSTTRCRATNPRDIGSWRVLLILRGNEPYKGCWSLPGGKLLDGEDVLVGAERELFEETGLRMSILHGPLVSHAVNERYSIHVCAARCETEPPVLAGDDADEARFLAVDRISEVSATPGLESTVREVAARLMDAALSTPLQS
jgi:8-oxo-dGTP diphosphatase